MKFNIITIFPDLISHYCNESILGRAQKEKLIAVNAIDLRDFTTDKHRTVDDTPYGGGAGMVLKPEPIYLALKELKALSKKIQDTRDKKQTNAKLKMQNAKGKKKTILLSPRGRQFDQNMAEEWSELRELTMVCGRYEGVDQRVVDYMVDEEISIGPYVLAGGELGALVILESVSRLIPGVLGNVESLLEETHGKLQIANCKLQIDKKKNKFAICNLQSAIEYPQYTKPAEFRGWKAPEVLLSGDHKKIAEWRREMVMSNE